MGFTVNVFDVQWQDAKTGTLKTDKMTLFDPDVTTVADAQKWLNDNDGASVTVTGISLTPPHGGVTRPPSGGRF